MSVKYVLAFWCNEGFESIQDVTAAHRAAFMKALRSDEHCPITENFNSMVTAMSMRARFNPQRNYECYTFTIDDTISVEVLQDIARDDPQAAANLFRRGCKIFSYRTTDTRKIK